MTKTDPGSRGQLHFWKIGNWDQQPQLIFAAKKTLPLALHNSAVLHWYNFIFLLQNENCGQIGGYHGITFGFFVWIRHFLLSVIRYSDTGDCRDCPCSAFNLLQSSETV